MASNIITADGKDLDERYMPKGTHIPANPNAYLVSSWHSGTNWWRKWSDGFIEQGGDIGATTTVNLHTPIPSGSYSAVATSTHSGIADIYGLVVYGKTSSKFNVYVGANAGRLMQKSWYAAGY